MIESSRPRLRRFANLGGLAVALALCGCGIKGPLEAPPSATLASSPPSATLASSSPSATPAASKSKDAK
ncbi:MAG: lipoprotein, partial [Xanthobacteraceae bacterium]|nr:lipoprotein [Xanthobacteraceae bacterium]